MKICHRCSNTGRFKVYGLDLTQRPRRPRAIEIDCPSCSDSDAKVEALKRAVRDLLWGREVPDGGGSILVEDYSPAELHVRLVELVGNPEEDAR